MVAGNIIRSFSTPAADSRGIAFNGSKFFIANIANTLVYLINRDGIVIKTMPQVNNSVIGLCYDGKQLYFTDSTTDLIYFSSQNSSILIRSFAAPGTVCRGIFFDGKYLWVYDTTKKIFCIDRNGVVISSLTFNTTNVGSGIATDGKYIYISEATTGLISKFTKNAQLISTFAGPNVNIFGMTFDGKNLIMTDRVANLTYVVTVS